MKFVEYQDRSRNRIHAIETGKIRINHTWLNFPCAISPQHQVLDHQLSALCLEAQLDTLIAIERPDLILIGLNRPIVFDQSWMLLLSKMQQQGIGLEQMKRDSAIRTFNVLTTEDRPIWLLLDDSVN